MFVAQMWHSCGRLAFQPCIKERAGQCNCWAEAPVKIARKTLTIKLDRNWSSFQLANNTPPLSVTGSVIAPSARMNAIPPDLRQHRIIFQ